MKPWGMLKKALILLFVFSLSACEAAELEPQVAGQFYPEDAVTLGAMVDELIARAENKPVNGRLLAIISPHAGYQFSGGVSAHGYKRLKGSGIKTVIIIGAAHNHSYEGASVWTNGAFKTPLGAVKIDGKLARRLIKKKAKVDFIPEVFSGEHSIEVQLPFLQRTLGDFKIVPIMIGNPTRESIEHLVSELTGMLYESENVLLVASTDLSHYHDYDTAVEMDGRLTGALSRLSLREVQELLAAGQAEMCGAFPVMVTLAAARGLGANESAIFKYANSGDATGDKGRVVGYLSAGFYRSPLTQAEKSELLGIARQTIIRYVKSRDVEEEPALKNGRLRVEGAVFVTITRGGMLRGCIGHIESVTSLYKSVIRNAYAASSMDPRFPPMTPEELKDMHIEISVLSPLRPIKKTSSIQVGRDGLYIVKGNRAGILLPQVAKDNGWDRKTFLKQVSLKAGLPEDAWKDAALYTFTAEVFGEGGAVPPPQ